MRRYRGFTLIEMVMVIVLLGIVGLSFGNIVSQGMGIYVDTTTREALAQKGRFITDRMLKELKNAVPGSVRVSNSDACIEWLPIKNTGLYETIPQTPRSATSLKILPERSLESGDRLAVFPVSVAGLYKAVTAPKGSVAEVSEDVAFTPGDSAGMVDVPLSSSHSFPATSPAKRIYVYDYPKSYCNVNNQIYLYKDYALTPDDIDPVAFSGTRVLMAEDVVARFNVDVPALQRNAQVKIELEFTDNGETLRFDHNVLVRNTP
jgi:MSHA biogenesis protein MshO